MAHEELSAGHKKLELLAGEWHGEEHMHPSEWDPAGGTAQGINITRLALGGLAAINDYVQKKDGKTTFEGHGIYSYNPEEDLYTMYWLDSIGSPPEIFTGRFVEKVLTMTSRNPNMQVRLRWDMTDPGRMLSSMEMSQDGKQWKQLFDAVYTRKS
ncbi:DUF1579 domain-containing protein [bacterium]|nr:DUF1579 domain-containing protein [bacterium]